MGLAKNNLVCPECCRALTDDPQGYFLRLVVLVFAEDKNYIDAVPLAEGGRERITDVPAGATARYHLGRINFSVNLDFFAVG